MATPVRTLFAGTTDASGNASIPIKAPPTMYAVLSVAATCAGNPNWSVGPVGQVLTYGNGPQVNLGPILTFPGENLVIQVANANPLAQVSGSLAGNQYLTAEEAAANYVPSANAVTISTFQRRQRLYPDGVTPASATSPSFTCAGGGTATERFTLPQGCVAVRLLATASGFLFSYQLYVGGHQTVEQYYGDPNVPGSPLTVPVPTLPFTIPVELDWDTQLDFSVVGDPARQISFFVSALLAPEAPGQAGAAQSVATIIPQPWQAPTNTAYQSLTTATTAMVVSGVAGLTTRVWGCQLEFDTGTTAVAVLEDSVRGSPSGRLLVLPDSGKTSVTIDHHGAALTVGAGVVLRVIGITGGGGVSAVVGYSQGNP